MAQLISPSAVYQPTLDRIAVFVRGFDDFHLYDKYWNGTQWVWEDQGIPSRGVRTAGPPNAVYQPTLDRIHVFARGFDDAHLYDKYWNGTQWVWEDQGDPGVFLAIDDRPNAVYTPTSDLYVFVTGSDRRLYDKYWNGTQFVWQDQGNPGVAVKSPSAVYQTTLGRIVIFVTGSDGHLYDQYWTETESVWEDQGNPGVDVVSPNAVYQPTLDRIVVFVTGSDGNLYDKYWNGTQWVWEDQGNPGVAVASPNAVYQPTLDRIVVFVTGNDGHLYDKYWDGTQWVWQDQGSPGLILFDSPRTIASLNAVYQPTLDRIHVFVTGDDDQFSDGHLYHLYGDYYGTQWVWEDLGMP